MQTQLHEAFTLLRHLVKLGQTGGEIAVLNQVGEG
jgi:hypothetical protein